MSGRRLANAGSARDRRVVLAMLVLAFALVTVLQWQGLDLRLADSLYRWQGETWRLRHDSLVATLLHRRAQQLTQFIYVLTLLGAIGARYSPRLRGWRRRLWYVVGAMSACYAIVSLGKALLPVPCPWDLVRYGGYLQAGHWLQWQTTGQHVKGCFPSGHATGGYALFAWYFAARDAGRRRIARCMFVGALGTGMAFGLVQQLRGAHFMSHDIAAAALCWALCSGLAGVWLRHSDPARRVRP